eukprot:m.182758 g.182758  ORF g.182758 m.182758 type:complete len:339 (-) comp24652_c0_seq1:1164-2180(-)
MFDRVHPSESDLSPVERCAPTMQSSHLGSTSDGPVDVLCAHTNPLAHTFPSARTTAVAGDTVSAPWGRRCGRRRRQRGNAVRRAGRALVGGVLPHGRDLRGGAAAASRRPHRRPTRRYRVSARRDRLLVHSGGFAASSFLSSGHRHGAGDRGVSRAVGAARASVDTPRQSPVAVLSLAVGGHDCEHVCVACRGEIWRVLQPAGARPKPARLGGRGGELCLSLGPLHAAARCTMPTAGRWVLRSGHVWVDHPGARIDRAAEFHPRRSDHHCAGHCDSAAGAVRARRGRRQGGRGDGSASQIYSVHAGWCRGAHPHLASGRAVGKSAGPANPPPTKGSGG